MSHLDNELTYHELVFEFKMILFERVIYKYIYLYNSNHILNVLAKKHYFSRVYSIKLKTI